MMKRIFIMFCCALSCISAVRACDACGCSAGGFGFGLLTDYRSNFIRLSYFESHFHSNPEYGHSNSSDVFSRMNISFRYSFSKLPKLRFVGDIPYGHNLRKDSGTKSSIHGLSDSKFLVNYVVVNRIFKNLKTSMYVEAGGGLSLPTGKYNANIINENLPDNFNIGNGSIGYLFQTNAILNLEKYGLLFNNSYQLNSSTKEGYHFGNQFSSKLTVFKEFPVKEFAVIPNVGLLFENISSNLYKNGNRVPETGGRGLFLSSAVNFKTEKWLAGVSFSLPMDQQYSSGVIDAGRKFAVQFSYLF